MKITDIRLTLLKVPPEKQKHKRHSVNPIHQFADLRYDVPSGKPRPDAPNVLIAHVDTDEGISGFSYGGYALPGAIPIIEQVLKPVVLGEDAMRTDWLWEKMYSVCIDQAGPGVTSKAISFIDTALWDLKGKMLNQPVYNLLGGKTKFVSTPATSTRTPPRTATLTSACSEKRQRCMWNRDSPPSNSVSASARGTVSKV